MKRLFKKNMDEIVMEIFHVDSRKDIDEVMDYLREEYRNIRIYFSRKATTSDNILIVTVAIDPICEDEMLGDYPSDTAYITSARCLEAQNLDYFNDELADKFFDSVEYIGEKE